MIKIKLTQDQMNLLEMGSKMELSNNECIYFLPFWFKIKENSLEGELYMLDNLPEEFKEYFKSLRNEP